tara:strand:+ start:1441 stop:2265 length:825 start_codon:yes stop_codon:yes gene_type:complete
LKDKDTILPPPPPIKISGNPKNNTIDNGLEMPFIDHLEELRQRILYSLLSIILCALASLIFVRPIVKLLEKPAGSIHFLQLAPGEFLFVSIKVAGYVGLTIALPYIIYQILAFILPGLTKKERQLIPPITAFSALLFFTGIFFAWWALVPAALKFLISYGADVVEPLWSIEKYLDFILILMFATGLAFQLPVLQLILGFFKLLTWKKMLSAWRWVVISSAISSAILTPSTDPITMLLLGSAITGLYFIGIAALAISEKIRLQILPDDHQHQEAK